jgi:hypothetical protein
MKLDHTIEAMWRGCLPVFLLLVFLIQSSACHAQCATPKEEGSWANVNPQTSSITLVQVRFVCQDQILNGKPYPPGPPYYIHIYGKCHPTDCDWGEVGATRPSTAITATYNQGFAKRLVYVRMSPARPDQLWVQTRTTFSDPRRASYTSNDYFIRR